MKTARWAWLIIAAAGCRDSSPATLEALHLEYQVTEQHLARNTAEARTYGLDLNGDKVVDNNLGAVFGVLIDQDLADPQASTDAALAAGTLQMTIELATTDPTFGGAAHVAVGTGTDRALIGDAAAAAVTAGPGDATLVIAPFGAPIALPLRGARIALQASETAMRGTIAGGLTSDTVQAVLIPSFAATLPALIARDCTNLHAPPSCGCASGGTGELAISTFDANHDCAVTLQEVADATVVQSLTEPDVTIDGEKLLSVGVGIAGPGQLLD